MPGLVALKEAPPLSIDVPGNGAAQIRRAADDNDLPREKRVPSPASMTRPSPSRAKPADRGSSSDGKRRLSLERPGSAAGTPKDVPAVIDGTDNSDVGPNPLKLARGVLASGEGPSKTPEYAIRASRSLERRGGEERRLELAMSLHVAAAIYSRLARHEEPVADLERAVAATEAARGPDHALAAISGCMQLGDTHAVAGRMEQSIACYAKGLEIQMEALEYNDPRVVETCRYLAEAGRTRNRKPKYLENLFVANSQRIKEVTQRWSGLGLKS